MRTGFDVDGLLANFNSAFIELVIAVTGEDRFPPRPFDIPTWHYPQFYGYSDEQMDFEHGPVWNAVRASKTFWAGLPPYAWTLDVLDELASRRAHGSDIYFITDRPGFRAKEQTEFWLHAMGYDNGTVLISGQKHLCARALKLDVYIDDRFENVIKVAEYSPETQTFLLSQPWNTGFVRDNFVRVATPFEMFKYLDG